MIIVCVCDCFIVIMECDGSVMVISISDVSISIIIDTNVIILFNDSLQFHISVMNCTYLGV